MVNKKAIIFLFSVIIVSAVSNLVNKDAMTAFGGNSFQYTFIKNALAAVFLCLLVMTPVIFLKLKELNYKEWCKLAVIGLVGGSIPFFLYFYGLSMTSALSASLLHKTLFIWIGILAWPLLKEKFTNFQYLGLAVLMLGVLLFDGLNNLKFGYPQLFIIAAVWLWAIENIISKKVLASIDSRVVAWGRMFFGAFYMGIFLLATSNFPNFLTVSPGQWYWLILVGVLLFLYNYFWYSAISLMPLTLAASIFCLSYPLGAFFSFIFVSHSFPVAKIIPSIVILLSSVILFLPFLKRNYGIINQS